MANGSYESYQKIMLTSKAFCPSLFPNVPKREESVLSCMDIGGVENSSTDVSGVRPLDILLYAPGELTAHIGSTPT